MSLAGELDGIIALSRDALERWDVRTGRNAAEKARALAMSCGDVQRVALADLLLARAALTVCADPHTLADSSPLTHANVSRELLGAHERFLTELDDARGGTGMPSRLPALAEDTHDGAAALALTGVVCMERSQRFPPAALRTPAVRNDAGGWGHLLRALESEWVGESGQQALELAIALAEERGSLALLSACLRLRVIQATRRGALEEADSARVRLRELVGKWSLTLTAADAVSALARPDRVALRASAPASNRTSNGRILTEAAVAFGQIRDCERLVELALDTAISATGAERGVLLLAEESGKPRVAATRYFDAASEASGILGLSSTIATRALKHGEVVTTNDVRSDPRFSECASIALEVTSVLCAPIQARGETEGAIYLDRRSRGRAFDSDAIAAAQTLGTMLASALLNARIIADLQTRRRELEAAREELSIALATRTAERDDAARRLSRVENVTLAGSGAIIGGSAPMVRLRRTIEIVAASNAPVLVVGETGSGKELVARALHAMSRRRERPFVAVNCGALSETLLAAELFGSVRGAYTGAAASRAGLFVAAETGTLFLDEVGDMPATMQTALLRVLETSEVRPVGSTQSRKVDVRVLAASHRDLVELVRNGKFRDDLRYRLDVVRIEVPPLRSHLEDLPELCERLLSDVRRQYELPERRLTAAALEVLGARRFAGNVRELRHVLANAALTAPAIAIQPDHLPPERAADRAATADSGDFAIPEEDSHAVRAEAIRRALLATKGHRGRAAKVLGISRATLYRHCEAHQIALGDVGGNEANE